MTGIEAINLLRKSGRSQFVLDRVEEEAGLFGTQYTSDRVVFILERDGFFDYAQIIKASQGGLLIEDVKPSPVNSPAPDMPSFGESKTAVTDPTVPGFRPTQTMSPEQPGFGPPDVEVPAPKPVPSPKPTASPVPQAPSRFGVGVVKE